MINSDSFSFCSMSKPESGETTFGLHDGKQQRDELASALPGYDAAVKGVDDAVDALESDPATSEAMLSMNQLTRSARVWQPRPLLMLTASIMPIPESWRNCLACLFSLSVSITLYIWSVIFWSDLPTSSVGFILVMQSFGLGGNLPNTTLWPRCTDLERLENSENVVFAQVNVCL